MDESGSKRIEKKADASRREGLRRGAVRPHKVSDGTAASPAPASVSAASPAAGTAAVVESSIKAYMKTLPDGSLSDVLWGSKVSKKEAAARKYFAIPAGEAIWLILDTTLFGSCKVGFALCEGGMRYHDERGKSGCLAWDAFRRATLGNDGGTMLVADRRFVTSNDTNDMLGLLRKLQKDLAR